MAEAATQQLAAIAAESTDQKSRIEKYKAFLAATVSSADVACLRAFVVHVTAEDVALVVARQVLQEMAAALPSLTPEVLKDVGTFALERIGSRVTSFEEQASTIREHLAAVYEKEEEWTLAAKMLAGIPLDSGIRVLEDNYKVEKYIKIAMLFLQDEESISAETYINRASLLISETTSDHLMLQHKVCYARILDAKRKFLEAASRYYQLSQLTTRTFGELTVSEEDMTMSLKMAVTCAVLAPAGPQRSRLLATLYKDERSHSLPNFSVLEKMFTERLLKKDEIEAFVTSLATHQKARVDDDGTTVVDRAIIEHNMLATSKLYANISFEQLGLLLGIDAPKAERTAAKMLVERRLRGTIDQPEARIHFDHNAAADDGSAAGAASSTEATSTTSATDSADALRAFDAQIEHICRAAELISNAIVAKHPEFAPVEQAQGA